MWGYLVSFHYSLIKLYLLNSKFHFASSNVQGLNFVFLIFGVWILTSTACTKNETEQLDDIQMGYNYFPVQIGNEWVYQTDSIIYSLQALVQIDSSRSFIREVVVDTFRDAVDQLIYRLNVFYAKDTSLGWDLINSSFIESNKLHLIKKENGLSFVRLVFPVLTNKAWDGNSMIQAKTNIVIKGELLEAYDDWYYRYKYIDKSEFIGVKSFDKVCKVLEVDNEDIISKRYSEARYARDVGMVYRELWILDTQNTDLNKSFRDRAEKGFILKQTLVSYFVQ